MLWKSFAWLAALAALVVGGGSGWSNDPDPPGGKAPRADVVKAEKAVKAYLEKVKGGYGTVTHVKDETLERTLPGHTFFAVLYRQFPVGRIPPAGLKVSNVFAVQDDRVEALTEKKDLERYFKTHLPPAANDEGLKDGVRAWLRVSQHLYQDGFYKFVLEDDSTRVTDNMKMKIASGKVTVTAGGNGLIHARLMYNMAGKLTAVSEDSKVNPGPRPICQATKLLDSDPIVRRMAEQDLLIMGRPAKTYLDEQRARASPELKKAIDRVWERILERDRD